ncbi:hypothetical protein NHX12_003287 [Muraenolepis orangiensis]|uniref:Uncharacterized protein n=1 Tax=Muraenolepis orangiensis TaxID=630683 RepID=A0A9Q0DY53_9TELE|nr:hypothetical protein NHX12_003287 [Muraenolepis orangiensis]
MFQPLRSSVDSNTTGINQECKHPNSTSTNQMPSVLTLMSEHCDVGFPLPLRSQSLQVQSIPSGKLSHIYRESERLDGSPSPPF